MVQQFPFHGKFRDPPWADSKAGRMMIKELRMSTPYVAGAVTFRGSFPREKPQFPPRENPAPSPKVIAAESIESTAGDLRKPAAARLLRFWKWAKEEGTGVEVRIREALFLALWCSAERKDERGAALWRRLSREINFHAHTNCLLMLLSRHILRTGR